MMWLAAMEGPASWHAFWNVKKAQEGLARVDAQGRSFWAYALSQGAAMDLDEISELIAKLPAPAPDFLGRGLIAQALSVFRVNSDRAGMIEGSPWGGTEAEERALGINLAMMDAFQDPKIWWGATKSAQNDLADFLTQDANWGVGGHWQIPRLIQHVWAIANETDIDSLSPKLLGAISLVQLTAPDAFSLMCGEQVPPDECSQDTRTISYLGVRRGFGGGGTHSQISEKRKRGCLRPLSMGALIPDFASINPALLRRLRAKETFPASWIDEWKAMAEANALRHAMAEAQSALQSGDSAEAVLGAEEPSPSTKKTQRL